MDRCALFVDGAYLLTTGAMAVHGTRQRDAVAWDHERLLELLDTLAREHTRLPSLRCYWYETADGGGTAEHDTLAEIAGVKLRLDSTGSGRHGIGAMAYRDLCTLAREHAICDAVLVSADEDAVHAVADAQDRGVRVTGVHIPVDDGSTIPLPLRRECDELIEVTAAQLGPCVGLADGDELSSSRLNGEVPAELAVTQVPASHGRHRVGDHASSQSEPRPLPPFRSAESAAHEGSVAAPPESRAEADSFAEAGESRQPEQNRRRGHNPGQWDGQDHGAQEEPHQAPDGTALSEAMRDAHREGRDFGDSVARDAPALWLEAVLARRPRMPSDLEARMLRGSDLAEDFLLHDDVRHALRRGFWEALEQPQR